VQSVAKGVFLVQVGLQIDLDKIYVTTLAKRATYINTDTLFIFWKYHFFKFSVIIFVGKPFPACIHTILHS